MEASEGQPLIEGPVADRWRSLSEEVQRARHAAAATGPNEALLAQAKQEREGELAPVLLLWAADSNLAEARFDAAIALYKEVPEREPVAASDAFDVRGEAMKATAEAYDALGDVDAAMEAHARLAESGLPGTSPARAWYEQGRVAAEARRDDEARTAFSRVADAEAGTGPAEVPYADLAKRAAARLDAGAAAARPHAEDLARELAAALRRRDRKALRGLASPTHFAVGLGGHFHFADRGSCSAAWPRTSRPPRCAPTRGRCRAAVSAGTSRRPAGPASGSRAPSR